MRLRLLRLDLDLVLDVGSVTTLCVADKTLFTRIVESLLSEQGEYAKEPYLLFDDNDKRTSTKRRLLILNALPSIPLNDRTLLSKLAKRVREMSEVDSGIYEDIATFSAKLNTAIEEASGFLRGEYGFATDWDIEAYLKAFSFLPQTSTDYSLLDNCMRLVEMIADIEPNMPLVMVNAKAFFTTEELVELFERTVFSGVRLLLLESYDEGPINEQELLISIDQHFCVI